VIIYDLKCGNAHKFEGWFQDRKAFEEQKNQKLIICPVCGGLDAEIALSSVAIVNRESAVEKTRKEEIPTLQSLQMLSEFIEKNFEDVGTSFAEVATSIHHGEEPERNIRGTTTKDEEESLREEGIHFIKIPTPKFDS
jgi:hypothetical protein